MSDSLLIGGLIELLAGGAPSEIPACAGVKFRLAKDTSFTLGAPQREAAMVGSLLLDGERPWGRRAGNRTVVLPIIIFAPPLPAGHTGADLAEGRRLLAAAREQLFTVADLDEWPLRWTRDGGAPLVFDCYSAQPAVIEYNLLRDRQLQSLVTLTVPAAPYGHTEDLVVLDFTSTATGGVLPPSPVVLDDYTTVSSTTQGSWWAQDGQHVSGSYSAKWDWSETSQDDCPYYSRTLPAPLDITGRSRFTFWLGLGSPQNYSTWHKGNVQFAFTLTDADGTRISFGATVYCTATNSRSVPAWTQITAAIPQAVTGFDYTQVKKYSIKAWRFIGLDGGGELDADSYLNYVTAQSATAGTPASTRGGTYQLLGIQGSARAPIAVLAQQAQISSAQTQAWTTGGQNATWIPPAKTTVARVRLKGPGGTGGKRTTAGSAGGAGGGEAVEYLYPVTPGEPVALHVGATGSTTWDSGAVAAHPGGTPADDTATGGAGGTGTALPGWLTGQNTGMEGGIGTWVPAGNAAVAATAAQAHGGAGAMAITAAGAGDAFAAHCAAADVLVEGMPVIAGGQVTASAWLRAATAARTCYTGVSWWDATGTQIGAVAYGSGVAGSNSGWVQVTAQLTAPAGAVTARLHVRAASCAGAGEIHYTDDPQLYPGVVLPGGAGAPGGGTNWLTGDSKTFDAGIGDWTAGTNAALARTTTNPRTGAGALSLTSGAAGSMYAGSCAVADVLTKGMPCSPGDILYGAGWLRAATAGRTCMVGWSFYDAAGTQIGSTGYGTGAADNSTGYTQVTVTSAAAPAGACRARLVIDVASAGAGGEVHQFDDPVMYQVGGGAGGSSAGDALAGVTPTGGGAPTAPSGGGAGGAGAAAGGNNNGAAGAAPGGGGGGAVSTGGTATGGGTAAGRVDVDWIQTLNTFKTLLLHTPGPDAPAALSPLVVVGNGADVPNGGTEYLVPAPAAGVNARFGGTYTVYAVASSWHNPGSARDVTITVKQYEYAGGPSYTGTAQRLAYVPNSPAPGEGNGIVAVDAITLPVRGVPAGNTAAYFTVTVTSSDTADRFLDVLFVDVDGSLVLVNLASGGYCQMWVDRPGGLIPVGEITGSAYERPQAVSVLGSAVISGEPLAVYPGDQWLLAYSVEGQPSLRVSYQPSYWVDQPLAGA